MISKYRRQQYALAVRVVLIAIATALVMLALDYLLTGAI